MPDQRDCKAPVAFLSYAHRDDQQTAGKITQLRTALELAVSSVVGTDFEIFQDSDAIEWGKQWQGRLDEALEKAQFLIPIITPSYFNSEPCRDELEKFVALERNAGGRDLILPLYFRTIRDFNTSQDQLVQLISRRQYRDWREVRNKPLDALEIREKIDGLADELGEAIANSLTTIRTGADSIGPSPKSRLAPPVIEPAFDETQLFELRARVDKLEEERTEREATISALRSARTTLEEELAETQPSTIAWRSAAASASALGLLIGAVGVWVIKNAEIDQFKAQLSELRGQLAAERREREAPRRLAEGLGPSQPLVIPASGSWQDCEQCPWMISLPDSTFTMGSPEDEEGRSDDEGPQREVTVQPFAIGQYEVTFDEWDACFADGGCSYKPGDQGWGRGKRPVINVSWYDARDYVRWLKEKTGEPYRLPSEAEWEYATRAGTETSYWWGAKATAENANYGGNVGKTTDVGSYPANPWGLRDTAGNVWEWCEDCWNESYEGAPKDGSVWSRGNCSLRVVRGGSWNYVPRGLRSADRSRSNPSDRSNNLGFRVAKTLPR
jgi:formylglycine-generating enzyme required for sulfatase activity